MKLKKIKSKKELEELFDEIRKQGFGYMNDYKAHNSKIDSIKSKSNILNVEVSDNQYSGTYNDNDTYSKIEKDIKKFFTKFKPDDKIREILRYFTIQSDDTAWFPNNWGVSRNDVIEWYDLKKKVGITEDPDYIAHHPKIRYYNFDKNVMKINYSSSYLYQFETLYKLIYGEEPLLKTRDIETGKWYNLGKIEIKIFNNGTMNIKGELKLMIKYQYEYIQRTGKTDIYRINKKLIIRNEETT